MLTIARTSEGTKVTIVDSTMNGEMDKKFATVMPNPLADANGFAGTMNVAGSAQDADDDDGSVETRSGGRPHGHRRAQAHAVREGRRANADRMTRSRDPRHGRSCRFYYGGGGN